ENSQFEGSSQRLRIQRTHRRASTPKACRKKTSRARRGLPETGYEEGRNVERQSSCARCSKDSAMASDAEPEPKATPNIPENIPAPEPATPMTIPGSFDDRWQAVPK